MMGKSSPPSCQQPEAGAGNGRSAAPLLVSRHIPPLLVAFDSTLVAGLRASSSKSRVEGTQ